MLHALRRSGWYRSVAGVPRNEIVGCAEYVRQRASSGDSIVPLDEPARVELASEPSEPGDGPRLFGELRGFDVPATFVATLERCRLYGRGIAVVGADGRVIAEGSPHIGGTPSDHAIMGRFRIPRTTRLGGTTAVLSAPAGNTYYHWLLDVVPRLDILRRAGIDLDAVDRFATNSTGHPFQRETLAAFGIGPERILETDAVRHAECERMVLPSYAGTSGFPPRWACAFLRSALAPPPAPGASAGPERIYVSRQRSRKRRIENATEVERLLERARFTPIFGEELTVAEQASLFRGARRIVAAHGSGLANLVFAEPGARVLELFPPERTASSHYRVLAAQAGALHAALVGERGSGGRSAGDFVVPPAKLEQLLARIA